MNKIILLISSLLLISQVAISQKSWVKEYEKGKTTLWTKPHANTNYKQFKLETTISGSIDNAYNILKNVENMPKWYDRVASVELLESLSPNSGIYLLEYNIPFPFTNRYAIIKGSIEFNPKSKTIIVNSKKHKGDYKHNKGDLVEITEIFSSWHIQANIDGTLLIKHEGFLHPSGNLSASLYNKGVVDGPVTTIENFTKLLSK